jgi:hypothetical protein
MSVRRAVGTAAARRWLAIAIAAVAAALLLAQLILPSLAGALLRDRLSRSGRVLSVSVSAFPAIELLWHHADRVTVRMATYSAGAGRFDAALAQASQVGSLSASVGRLHVGRLTLTNVQLRKRGSELNGTARVSETALRAAVPFLRSLTLVRSGGGALTFKGTSTLLGIAATATVESTDGRLVVVPDLPLVGGLLGLTVFADPRVEVQGVSASTSAGGLALNARARLR